MKKTLCAIGLISSMLVPGSSLFAQDASVLPDLMSPAPSSSVLRPQNVGSSTLQNVLFGGMPNNLYVHSWDMYSSYANNGIAWIRTDAAGGLLDNGYLPIQYADDIDVALFEVGGKYFALAAFYYNDGTAATRGHYYNLYNFTPTGLVAVSSMNLLTLSPAFSRINVDANTPYGVAITWCRPGAGILVKAAAFPSMAFGPNYLIPGTAGFKDPDICINRYSGGLKLQVASLSNTNTQIQEQRLDLNDIASGAFAIPPVTESVVSATPGMTFSVPRIDCPDASGVQKWAMVYSEYSASGYVPSVSIAETVYANVLNTAASPTPATVAVHSAGYTVASGFFQVNNPVVAYNDNNDLIHVGWITTESTVIIPGTNTIKYVAQYIADPPSGPVSIPGSYMMISNTPATAFGVLAFSGQNTMSGFDGLHTVFCQNTYDLMYKNKPWPSATFKLAGTDKAAPAIAPAVYPNPFVNTLSLSLPLKGHYDISITSIDGKSVYTTNGDYEAMQHINIPTTAFMPGTYLVRVSSPENNIAFIQKITK